jgi:hypothetical protein
MSRFVQVFGAFGVISVLSVGLLISSGCSPDLGAAPFKCNAGSPKCPEGYECNPGNICVQSGTCPEGIPGCGVVPPIGCGDGSCNAQDGETCENCEKDCGKCQPGCGDGTCTAPKEDCGTCPADCGKCPPVCGDNKCELPETAATCPQDCSTTQCGNGKCETGETVSNCPVDCQPKPVCGDSKCELPETEATCPADCKAGCPTPDTKCKDADTLEYCQDGKWTTEACSAVCATKYDYTTGCKFSSQSNKDVCICGNYSAFGEVCNADAKCEAGLICASFGGADGFCTRTCTNVGGFCSGAGFYDAECSSQKINGQNVCIFVCDFFIGCPQGLTCSDPLLGGICQP